MGKAITKRYSDESDLRSFRFTFYCDCCGKTFPFSRVEYRGRFRGKVFLSQEEREARAVLYADAHEAAFTRANNEMRLELERCELCGSMICQECAVSPPELHGGVCCKNCAEQLKRRKE